MIRDGKMFFCRRDFRVRLSGFVLVFVIALMPTSTDVKRNGAGDELPQSAPAHRKRKRKRENDLETRASKKSRAPPTAQATYLILCLCMLCSFCGF
jgi:hypothetical protein